MPERWDDRNVIEAIKAMPMEVRMNVGDRLRSLLTPLMLHVEHDPHARDEIYAIKDELQRLGF